MYAKKNKNNFINNLDIIEIQQDIDNLEKKLFSSDDNINITKKSDTINHNNSIKDINKITSKNTQNIFEEINEEENSEESDGGTGKNPTNKNNNNKKLINNFDNKKKILELLKLQKEVDKLREKRGQKIIQKIENLNKDYKKFK